MSTKHALWIVLAASLLVPSAAVAQIVIATETAAGEYEGGTFTAVDPQFRMRFEIDEPAGQATLTETVRLKSGTLIENTVAYQIAATEDGASASNHFLRSENRRGQKLLTLVGKPGTLATEVIILGDDFFEYCKASAGRLYLSTGTVQRAASLEEDTQRLLLRGVPFQR